MAATLKTPTLSEFQSFARTYASAAKAVVMARVFAEMERERVRAYTLPIFQTYRFEVRPDWRMAGRPEVITDPDQLYLTDDEAGTAAYYAACDAAHRAHGFTGPTGHCPALVADTLRVTAENHFLALAQPLCGIDPSRVYGKDRAAYLTLLLNACLGTK